VPAEGPLLCAEREIMNTDASIETQQATPPARRGVILAFAIGLPLCLALCAAGVYLLVMLGRLAYVPASAITSTPPITADDNLTSARSWIAVGDWEHALPYLDRAIELSPEFGTAYFYRALAHTNLASGSHLKEAARMQLVWAAADIDHAIQYGVIDSSVAPGEPYYVRYRIYQNLFGAGDEVMSDADIQVETEVSLENLRWAEALQMNNNYNNQWIALIYFYAGQCDKGWAEFRRIGLKYGLSSPPNASMYSLEAQGHMCDGQFEQALEAEDKSLGIEYFAERDFTRSLIRYHLGLKDEALAALDQLIAVQPNYGGDRYYLRALIYYDRGDRARALAEISRGESNTWGRGGLRAYVLGRMALDDGRTAEAIQDLQFADLTLSPLLEGPLMTSAEQELHDLGAEAPARPGGAPSFEVTPMPEPPPLPAPSFPTAANGLQLPPDPIPMDMSLGTGQYSIEGEYARPILLFQPHGPVAIETVRSLTVHLQPAVAGQPERFEVFVWNPNTGEWTMYKPGWHDFTVDDPGQYVAANGDLYLAIRTDTGINLYFKQLWVTIQATGADGSPVLLDLVK
jgi:tetratricopeptide (TPR) repeat protein